MSTDFKALTQAKNATASPIPRAAPDTAELEKLLIEKHNLRFELAKVHYLFDPLALRVDSLDFSALVRLLHEKYELHFDIPDLVHLAIANQDTEPEGPNKRLRETLANTGLNFTDGILKYQDAGVDIERVIRGGNIHSQNLHIVVDGTTREAEFIARRIAQDILEAQKLKPNADRFFAFVDGVRYTTTTSFQLGATTDALLSPDLNTVLKATLEQDLGWKSAMLPTQRVKKEKQHFAVKCVFKSVSFAVGIFDTQSGDHYESTLTLSTPDRRYFGSDLLAVTSDLSSDDHIKLVAALVESVRR